MPDAQNVYNIMTNRATDEQRARRPDCNSTARNPHIEVLNQLIDEEKGSYRILVGTKVRYMTIRTDVFDDKTMCRPYLLIPSLPPLPDTAWTRIHITRTEDGSLRTAISNAPLPGIDWTWHDRLVDILSLERLHYLRSGVHLVMYEGRQAIAKYACFEWQLRQIEREMWAYSVMAEHPCQDERRVAPAFLGHLTEHGRVMGFLMEKLDGGPACVADLPQCEAAVRRVHRLGLVHGDVNRFNFVVDRHSVGSVVRLVDFEHASEYEAGAAEEELASLKTELAEESYRGGTSIVVDGVVMGADHVPVHCI